MVWAWPVCETQMKCKSPSSQRGGYKRETALEAEREGAMVESSHRTFERRPNVMPNAAVPELQGYHFGQFDIDLRSGELRKQGVRIKLQEQPFQVLTMLLERPGEIVT